MENRQNKTNDARGDFRIKENAQVSWNIAGNGHRGEGRVRNISFSGMLVELDRNFEPSEKCLLNFNNRIGKGNFIPESGQLVWYKKTDSARNPYLCGITFVSPSEYIAEKLKKRLDSRTLRLKRMEPFLKWLFLGVFVAINALIIWLSFEFKKDMFSSQSNMNNVTGQQAAIALGLNQDLAHVKTQLEATRALYIESQAELQNVKQELAATKTLLDRSEALLAESNSENSRLKQEVQDTRDSLQKQLSEISEAKVKLENEVVLLEEKSTQMAQDMNALQTKLDYYSGKVKNMDEARSWIAAYKENLKFVKVRVHEFKAQAQKARELAMQEQDRVRLILGNNGYFVKNGQVVKVDAKRYRDAQLDSIEQTTSSPQSTQEQPIKVNVTFVD